MWSVYLHLPECKLLVLIWCRFLQVLSSIYHMAHPVLKPDDDSVTVVLLQGEASKT